MATISALTEDFEGGSDGVDVTTGNTNATNIQGTTPTFSEDRAITGTLSMHVAPGGTFSYVQFDTSNQDEIRFDLYVYFTTIPTTSTAIAWWGNGTTKIGDLHLLSGALRIRDGNTARWTASHTPTTGQWYRLSVQCVPGSATGHRARLFYGANLNGTTPNEDSGGQTATNASQTAVNRLRVGSIAASTSNFYIDSITTDDTDWPAPAVASNTPPTADAGEDQNGIEPYSTVTLDGSGSSDPDGTITGYNWTQTSGPTVTLSGSGATRTFTAPPTMSGAALTFSLTVEDDGEETSDPDTVTVNVLPHNRWVVAADNETRLPARVSVVPVLPL